jgi:hypothetical protein
MPKAPKNGKADFDISTLDLEGASERGSEVEIRHPQTGEPVGIFVKVYGPDSKLCRRILSEGARMAATDPTEDEKELQRRSSQMTAELCMGWRQGDEPTIMWEGTRHPFSKELAVKIFTKQQWFRQQVDQWQMNRRNFS